MYAYRTPGVYFEWQDKTPVRLPALRTDIAGVVGIAARGPLHRAVKVESWTQFVSLYGGHIPQGYLAYAVEGFFANGGRTCWVVRVADPDTAATAGLCLRDDEGQDTLCLHASSEGRWAHQLIVTVLRTGRERFTLLLRHAEGGQEVWPDLTMAVAEVEILSAQNRPVLRLIGTHPTLWDEAQQGRATVATVTPGPGDRFDLTVTMGTITETWPDLTLDRNDPRYALTVLNDPMAGSALLVARDPRPADSGDAVQLHGRGWPLRILPRYVREILNDEAAGSAWVSAEHLTSSVVFPANTPNPRADNLHQGSARLADGADGLESLELKHLAGESGVPTGQCRGLGCLVSIAEVSIVAMPDIMPKPVYARDFKPTPPDCTVLEPPPQPPEPIPQDEPEHPPPFSLAQIAELQQAMVRQCETLKDRVAVLEFPPEHQSRAAMLAWRRGFDTGYAALYAPWLRTPDPLQLEGVLRPVPPSGHVAGIYARSDLETGVHKPPANQALEAAKALAFDIDDNLHGELNDARINAIRLYSGRGLRVSGARTLSSDTQLRYINVRRLLIMIKAALEQGTRDLVFEPHNQDLWRKIERRVRAFLDGLWRAGSLDGATAEAAYSVRCDAETNPPAQQDLGIVLCEIGVLPPWPAEFVIVRIGFTQSGAQLIEGGV